MKKVLIGFLIVLFVLFTVRTIRLRQLGKEASILMQKSDIMIDSIRASMYSNTRDFSRDTAFSNRVNKVARQLDTLEKKINFWNLKM
jgi:hypothetical protein